MVNGPGHYAEAERLIAEANHVGHSDPDRGAGVLAAAQVHATLALAAEKNSGPPWTQEDVTAMAGELRELRAVVRAALEDSEHGRPHEIDVHHLARLRELVGAQVHATLALAGANVGQDEREASRLLRYQRDAAVTEINTLRRVVQRYMRLPDGSDREAAGASLIDLVGGAS